MINLFNIFLIVIVLFFVLLIVKQFLKSFKDKFCVICITVSITWVFLLILSKLGVFDDKVIIALLMGETILGIYYILDGNVKEELKIFRLPFLLTLVFLGYLFLVIPNEVIEIIILLLILWLIFILIYLYRNNEKMKFAVKKIIGCCKRW